MSGLIGPGAASEEVSDEGDRVSERRGAHELESEHPNRVLEPCRFGAPASEGPQSVAPPAFEPGGAGEAALGPCPEGHSGLAARTNHRLCPGYTGIPLA